MGMWIFMRDSYLSIVEHESEPRLLHIRARIRGDIEQIFPEADVVETLDADYRFRTSLPRDRVAQALALRLSKIDYSNFKSSVKEPGRHHAYMKVWSTMYDEQQRRYGPPPADVEEPAPPPRYVLDDPRYSLEAEDEDVSVSEELVPESA